ncbi:HisA/HisF-related TIM barrel protein [Pseudofulvimonas gallinarii]|uniref:1-(5-phosphoribosyl)-5-[(5-phosphoribosylamino)methylideneamino] imidazole-4-carboxamide isomerase n=1 Tax=Pseudofulvimonas gallinarii TaxID=634155 RepID=A0A4S3KW79_9GAMM|nr:HisA/HisF-related TIM barrel protein [Pseudofulvimonas gallinarii]TCS97570.1 1-(5-phosphoribosyl)-5-[(5-phosphoribosylamino)methylideneamino] imidazole-4-carboxamide isomerase [Pseudofulvimonas gallinarii]THD13450.1 hypothetical protein B1808_07985 [Pseudofulvimonas gallinarii]
MKLIPAIDLRDGKVVRLHRGDFDRQREFDVDPLSLARRYRDAGADWLHVVDLDGARAGEPRALDLLSGIAATGLNVQWGGGVRSRGHVDALLAAGAKRVVVGSVAARQPATFASWLHELGGGPLCLALDVHVDADGACRIAVDAWQGVAEAGLDVLLPRFIDAGLRHVLSTDIARDGDASGPNVELYARLVSAWPTLQWIASGGIRDRADLARLSGSGVAAAVAGTALLDGTLPLDVIGAMCWETP